VLKFRIELGTLRVKSPRVTTVHIANITTVLTLDPVRNSPRNKFCVRTEDPLDGLDRTVPNKTRLWLKQIQQSISYPQSMCLLATINAILWQHPYLGLGRLVVEVSRSHSYTPHLDEGSARIYKHTAFTGDERPCLRQESNPQSQPAEPQIYACDRAATGMSCTLQYEVDTHTHTYTHTHTV
jgi:hypothetical protein